MEESNDEADEDQQEANEEQLNRVEARLLARLRAERGGQDDFDRASVSRALFCIRPLVEKNFEVWLQRVSDAFTGAGLDMLFRLSGVPTDDMAQDGDVELYRVVPMPIKRLIWTALKNSIGEETTAYARTLAVESGDSLALLRSLRIYYERNTVPFRHQLMAEMAKTVLADYAGFKQYVAALETSFTRLAKMGHVVVDKDKLFYLLQGLTDEYKKGIVGSILAYESPHTGAPADFAKAV